MDIATMIIAWCHARHGTAQVAVDKEEALIAVGTGGEVLLHQYWTFALKT